jgi:hypothetical protein
LDGTFEQSSFNLTNARQRMNAKCKTISCFVFCLVVLVDTSFIFNVDSPAAVLGDIVFVMPGQERVGSKHVFETLHLFFVA